MNELFRADSEYIFQYPYSSPFRPYSSLGEMQLLQLTIYI